MFIMCIKYDYIINPVSSCHCLYNILDALLLLVFLSLNNMQLPSQPNSKTAQHIFNHLKSNYGSYKFFLQSNNSEDGPKVNNKIQKQNGV